MFKLALIQMLVEGGRKEANLARAEERIRSAAVLGAQVVVLPEAMTLGWTDPSARDQADEIPDGPAFRRLRNTAQANKVYVCSGMIERQAEKIFNSAVLIDPDGNLLLHYRKINELEIGHDLYALGDRLQVVPTPFGIFGVMICADAFVRGQTISRTLSQMGADIILSPCAWAVPSDHDNEKTPYGSLWLENYQPVARDFRVWIAGVSNVGWIAAGPWQGRQCIGCSMVIDPSGEAVLRGPYGAAADSILTVDVQLEKRPAQGEGWKRFWTGVA
jgi:predicted amidohydrolase